MFSVSRSVDTLSFCYDPEQCCASATACDPWSASSAMFATRDSKLIRALFTWLGASKTQVLHFALSGT